jgi:hypothetical protein
MSYIIYTLSNRNEYQIFLVVKEGRLLELITHRHLRADCLENVAASTSYNPMGLHGLLKG